MKTLTADATTDDRADVLGRLITKSWDYYDCWIWEGATNGVGYGQISYRGKKTYTHRLAYSLFRGPIPEGAWSSITCAATPCAGGPPTWNRSPR